ncbi:MAG: EF-P beta-lysylation protein EpmB [Gammaproteobacteria bacterium]|jgi:EF-P beta-lysylation protein EpmB|nr:EF-P beta-lysylation protein EpmB [Gammaproteobacteria bacterium]
MTHWKTLLRDAITDPAELLKMLDLPADHLAEMRQAEQLFTMRVPRNFIARIQKGNPRDPLLLQVLPLGLETLDVADFVEDPLGEQAANPIPGLLHKYHGRVLLVTNGHCAVQCRYCFRRHFEYQDQNPGQKGWQRAFDYIAKDSSIHEVILSGGDPLTLTDQSLKGLLAHVNALPQLKTIRFHSRIPIVLPERIDADFIALFKETTLNKVMVIHCNHPQELDRSVLKALQALKEIGFTLLNQSVLLKGINDTLPIQLTLQHTLFDYGVLPYYLHVLDRTKGVAHFEVSESAAKTLHKAMRHHLPGYLVPKLARETAGEPAKTLLNE